MQPTGLVVPGDAGIQPVDPDLLQGFCTKIGIAYSPNFTSGALGKMFGANGKTSIRSGWGLFYNPMEQLVLEQFGAEPPFGGSTYLPATFFNTPFIRPDRNRKSESVQRHPQPHAGNATGLVELPADAALWRLPAEDADAVHRAVQLYDPARTGTRLVMQIGYVGSQGHRLLASHDINRGESAILSRHHARSPAKCTHFNHRHLLRCTRATCGQFAEDNQYSVTLPAAEQPDSCPTDSICRTALPWQCRRTDAEPGWSSPVFLAELQSDWPGFYGGHGLPD